MSGPQVQGKALTRRHRSSWHFSAELDKLRTDISTFGDGRSGVERDPAALEQFVEETCHLPP